MRNLYRLQIKAELEALDNLRSQGSVPVSTQSSVQEPATGDLLGCKDLVPSESEPSYKDLLAEEESDAEEETIFPPLR